MVPVIALVVIPVIALVVVPVMALGVVPVMLKLMLETYSCDFTSCELSIIVGANRICKFGVGI